jgi:DNA repair protein RecN (Recombination protein N)
LAAQIADLARIDPVLRPAGDLIESARVQLEEAALELRSYAERVQFDPERQDEIESRLALLARLSRKHALRSAELPGRLVELRAALAAISGEGTDVEELQRAVDGARAEALAIAGELSKARREAARRLERKMREELGRLGLDGAVFRSAQRTPATAEAAAALGSDGFDQVEFLLSANQGEEPRPLARVASGGELSRVMLALKALTATRTERPILIFDEVDAGIGGLVADAVARRLKALAATRQLLCITHLPQIAAYADHHLAVEKERRQGRTIARARELAGDERIRELSRMLGGEVAPAEAESYARRLIAEARVSAPVT